MRVAVEEARKAGWPFVILVGDLPYYWPFGFRPLPPGKVQMPGPVDPARLLVAELIPGSAEGLGGLVKGVPERPGDGTGFGSTSRCRQRTPGPSAGSSALGRTK
jgi:predicted N-acetyltransferase YhbS